MNAVPRPVAPRGPLRGAEPLPALAHEESLARQRDGLPWLVGFVLYEFACQLLLLVPALGAFRIVLRTAAFAGSLVLLLMLPGQPLSKHPARAPLTLVALLLGISAVNPAGGGPLASAAHLLLHLAILAPLFWVARLRVTPRTFEIMLLTFWGYYTLSATFGLLQVYFPGSFQPPLASVLAERGPAYLDAMQIKLASGATVLRPMGLTDTPGGAAFAGFYAALFGLGLLFGRPTIKGVRWGAAVSILLGCMVLYLSQVRSLVVALGLSTLVMSALNGFAGRFSKVTLAGGLAAALAVLAYSFAVDVGGSTVSNRLATLTAQAPSNVYYTNRGVFLEHTFYELLPQFPLGGGLGRWGMMNAYFGSRGTGIWVEVQWTGWLIDGGVLNIAAYAAAIVASVYVAVRLALSRAVNPMFPWAALVAAYALGVFATTFNSTPFAGGAGLDFWLVNAAFFQASTYVLAEPARSTSS